MPTILCFGDSLTWGFRPEDGSRYPFAERWPNVMQRELGSDFRVIEEALCGRTTVYDDPASLGRRGDEVLPLLLESHLPLDLVVILLGSNDLKPFLAGTAAQAARGAGKLVIQALQSFAGIGGARPRVLLLAPPAFGPLSPLMSLHFGGREEESKNMGAAYRPLAEFFKIPLLDLGPLVSITGGDGVHLSPTDNETVGRAVAAKVREIFAKP